MPIRQEQHVNHELVLPQIPNVLENEIVLGAGSPTFIITGEVQRHFVPNVSQPSPTVRLEHVTVGAMERQCLDWSTKIDPTLTYMLYTRLYPCACPFCIINDFNKCIYTEECGRYIQQPIKYVPLPPPKTESVSQQTIYDFFKGAVSSDDVGPILVIIKSNHGVGEFKIGVLQKAITIVKGKKSIEVIKRIGKPDELRKWDKGDVQFKVKILTSYIENSATRSYFLKVRASSDLISIKCVILPINHDSNNVDRQNYLNITSADTKMNIDGRSQKRVVFSYSEETEDMIHLSLESVSLEDGGVIEEDGDDDEDVDES
jgi:hypothetical protein